MKKADILTIIASNEELAKTIAKELLQYQEKKEIDIKNTEYIGNDKYNVSVEYNEKSSQATLNLYANSVDEAKIIAEETLKMLNKEDIIIISVENLGNGKYDVSTEYNQPQELRGKTLTYGI